MVSLIGPPPSEFVRRSETTEQCFNPTGMCRIISLEGLDRDHRTGSDTRVGGWIASEHATVPPVSLGNREKRLTGQEKELFLQFLRSMLKWLPEERRTARQLLNDPWLL